MGLHGKAQVLLVLTVGPDEVAEGDRLVASHASWIEGRPRSGELALLSYSVSKGPQLSNPLDPGSESTAAVRVRTRGR